MELVLAIVLSTGHDHTDFRITGDVASRGITHLAMAARGTTAPSLTVPDILGTATTSLAISDTVPQFRTIMATVTRTPRMFRRTITSAEPGTTVRTGMVRHTATEPHTPMTDDWPRVEDLKPDDFSFSILVFLRWQPQPAGPQTARNEDEIGRSFYIVVQPQKLLGPVVLIQQAGRVTVKQFVGGVDGLNCC